MSEKFDGIRAFWDPTTQNFYTRGGSIIKTPPSFKENMPNIPLDGELWTERGFYRGATSLLLNKTNKHWEQVSKPKKLQNLRNFRLNFVFSMLSMEIK